MSREGHSTSGFTKSSNHRHSAPSSLMSRCAKVVFPDNGRPSMATNRGFCLEPTRATTSSNVSMVSPARDAHDVAVLRYGSGSGRREAFRHSRGGAFDIILILRPHHQQCPVGAPTTWSTMMTTSDLPSCVEPYLDSFEQSFAAANYTRGTL